MNQEHEIVAKVCAAKKDTQAADLLLRQYLPFIKSETAKFIHRIPIEGHDDELSIAMFAFHESVLAYQKGKGAFLSFAATAIRNRLIDYQRKEQRHFGLISLDQKDGEEEGSSLLEKLGAGRDEIAEMEERSGARVEIQDFNQTLDRYGLDLTDIADNCPKQERTLKACHRALNYAKAHPELFEALISTKKLPLAQLAIGSGVERKTLERHRKYMIALLLAYTNGFEIIRGHLKQMSPTEGGQNV